ncbi:MAG: molybdopterin dehydrogenase [Dethiosulfovibrio peptidovorans]|nr:MAG: molybdopterin dehydrogenase [Dethiosulfovibrio peptidovorans]
MKLTVHINGDPFEIEARPLDRLLDILRRYRGLTGTKEGCGEGECGACAVILDGLLVNACMVPAVELHGSRVVTVEGLKGKDDPLQRAFVELGAVQCGFCIPGMVMASRALLARHPHPTREQIKQGLAGNLCRCTGYEKIIKAVTQAADEGYGEIARADLADLDLVRPEFSAILSSDERDRVFLPYEVNDACEVLDRFDDVYMVAGTTDMYPDLKKGTKAPERIMDLTHLCDLKKIERLGRGAVIVGSGVTTQRLADHPLIRQYFPALQSAADQSAAIAIKNKATMGGNLMTASPAADMPPVLLMLGATVVFRSLRGRRKVPMDSFFKGYRTTDRRSDELLESVIIPIPEPGTSQAFFKRGSRKSLTISRVNVACSARLEGGVVRDFRGVAGTMSVLPTLLDPVSDLLEGKALTDRCIEMARETTRDVVHPRTSKEYRKNVTGNMVARFLSDLNRSYS